MTISGYENEVQKIKNIQKKTRCPNCLILQDQYIAHMNKVLQMMRDVQKTVQFALIDLDHGMKDHAIENARDRLKTLLPENE